MQRGYRFNSMDSLFGQEGSPAMQSILETIARIAMSDLGVLIAGESGTEKELLARKIHELSGRAHQQFVHLNCSAFAHDLSGRELLGSEDMTLVGIEIQPGIIETAHGGTVYFDNISELPSTLRSKICRMVEDRYFRRVGGVEVVDVNARVIASISNRSGETFVHEGSRRELYYRMCAVCINLPPLRERREDIPILIEQYVLEAKNRTSHRLKGITNEALKLCLSYDWPGNTQELHQAMEHALVACSNQFIRKSHLPKYLQGYGTKDDERWTNNPVLTEVSSSFCPKEDDCE